jgi:hypothetical protein
MQFLFFLEANHAVSISSEDNYAVFSEGTGAMQFL